MRTPLVSWQLCALLPSWIPVPGRATQAGLPLQGFLRAINARATVRVCQSGWRNATAKLPADWPVLPACPSACLPAGQQLAVYPMMMQVVADSGSMRPHFLPLYVNREHTPRKRSAGGVPADTPGVKDEQDDGPPPLEPLEVDWQDEEAAAAVLNSMAGGPAPQNGGAGPSKRPRQ